MKELKKASDGKRPELKLSIGYKDYRLPKDIDRIKIYLDRFEYYLNYIDWSESSGFPKPSFLMNYLNIEKISDIDNYEINNEEVSTGDTLATQWLNNYLYGNQFSKLYAEITETLLSGDECGMSFILYEDYAISELEGISNVSINSKFMKNAFPSKLTTIVIEKSCTITSDEVHTLFSINADVVINDFNTEELEETILYRFLLLNIIAKYIAILLHSKGVDLKSFDVAIGTLNIYGYKYKEIESLYDKSMDEKEVYLSSIKVEEHITDLSSYIKDGSFSLGNLFELIKLNKFTTK